MAKVECVVCGKNMLTSSKNAIFNSGVWSHKKCPSKQKKMSPEEAMVKRELTDRIQFLAIKHDKCLNWSLISNQIRQLYEEGYNYEEQLYALNYVYEKDGDEFWGYGRIRKFVEHARAHKKKMDEYENRKRKEEAENTEEQSVGLKFKSTNSFINF